MRMGCAGCLTVLAFWSFVALGTAGAGGWVAFRLTQAPDIEVPATTQADSARAQRKIFGIARGAGSPPRTKGAIVLTERELNALIARQLAGEIPFSTPVARLPGGGTLHFAGRLPVRQLVAEQPLAALGTVLPETWLDRPVWLQVRARVTVEQGARAYARVHVDELQVGRQRLPVLLLRLLLDPASLTLLHLPLPDTVEDIHIEPGQVIIRTAS